MKFGYFNQLQMPKPWPENAEVLLYKEAMEQAVHAESMGFDYYWQTEHHFYTEIGHSSAPELFLAALAQRTTKIRLGPAVVVLPCNHPYRVVEYISTLDILSDGRVEFGTGRGASAYHIEAFGVSPDDSKEIWEESLEVICSMFVNDPFPGWQGKWYPNLLERSLVPKPVQKPHPPIWVGGESRPALRRTAELADGWYPLGSNPTFPMGTPGQLRAGLERLAGYAERFGRDPSTIETIYRTHQFELLKQAAGPDRLPFVGDADQIAGDIRQYQDMGVTSMIWDFLRQTDDLDSMLGLMEDFSTQVWPKV